MCCFYSFASLGAVLQTFGINASHDLTGDKEEFLAEIPQILLPARACEVPLQSRGQKNFPYPRCYIQ